MAKEKKQKVWGGEFRIWKFNGSTSYHTDVTENQLVDILLENASRNDGVVQGIREIEHINDPSKSVNLRPDRNAKLDEDDQSK